MVEKLSFRPAVSTAAPSFLQFSQSVADTIARRLNIPREVIATDSPPTDRPQLSAHVIRRQSSKRTLKHLHEVANAVAEIDRLPERDESIHCLMRGDFHGWDLVPAILHLAQPATIAALYVATLGFNKQNATELVELIDSGSIGRVVFLCSCYFQKSCPAEFELLRNGLTLRGRTVVATRTHAKVIAARLTDGRCIVVESSANLRSCRNIEQLCMTESPDLFGFHQFWMDEVVSQCLAKSK